MSVSPRAPGQLKQQTMPERALTASPASPNLTKPQLYRDALHRFMPPGGLKKNGAALVIPDYAVRMAVLDFEEFPSGEDDRAALLRFRLRKTVPFHIDEAQLAYSVQIEQPKHVEVLAVAMARPILNEYEALFVDAGYRVGIVTPSSIASLRLCGTTDKGLNLLAKVAGATISVFLLQQGRVRLVRCLDLTAGEGESVKSTEQTVMPLLQQTLAYAEDQIGEPVGKLLLCGFGPLADVLGERAETEFGTPYAIVRSRFGAASQENAGLLGLLEQYAA
jgi:type IV pilus assembly protein PilM